MFFKIDTFALSGINAVKVNVEVNISNGLPTFSIVGLPDKSINEAKDRVKASIINSGFKFPKKKIIINLAPADIRKEGPYYDLPIALSILSLSNQLKHDFLLFSCFIGELSLNGAINPVKGVLCMAEKAKELHKKYFFVPIKNYDEAFMIKGIDIIPCENLSQCVYLLEEEKRIKKHHSFIHTSQETKTELNIKNNGILDFRDIRGQIRAKRAMEVAVSGFHNILLIGPPGSGKSMLAKRAPTIIPKLSFQESIEVTKIYSIYKKTIGSLITDRPFRNPHHSISVAGMIGGGSNIKPGEISLADRGVLFLDEFSEFSTKIIESLRQPLEDKEITISRNGSSFNLPCFFMLILAMNPCYCGFYKDKKEKCKCSTREIERYWRKISGPMLDRIDIQISMPRERISRDKEEESESSGEIKTRVKKVYEKQIERNKKFDFDFNTQASPFAINEWLCADGSVKNIVYEYSRKLNLSSRQISSLIKVSRTIADMDDSDTITQEHIAEALQYKMILSKIYFSGSF